MIARNRRRRVTATNVATLLAILQTRRAKPLPALGQIASLNAATVAERIGTATALSGRTPK
eukprot:2266894-Pleurochrysis_carterae.AAC.1